MIAEAVQLTKLLRNQRLSRDRLKQLQDRKVRDLVAHAYQHVPFYRTFFERAGIRPEDIRSVDDLDLIPSISKDDLKTAGIENCIASTVDVKKCISIQTSGSTGKKFIYYVSKEEERIRRLIEFRSLLNIGFRPQDRLTVLGPETPHRRRLQQHLGFFRSDNISSLLPSTEQLTRLRTMRPTILWVYPTVLEVLLRALGCALSEVVRPRLMITSAEVFPNHLRERITRDMDLEILNFYAANEIGRIAYECSSHSGLHVNSDHVILQTIPIGEVGESDEQMSEAVLTSLNAYTMPLIRYKIGDLCSIIEKDCPCGCHFPLIASPIGRTNDIFELPSGRLISPISLGMIVRGLDHSKQYRLTQESKSSLLLEIAFDAPPKDIDMLGLKQRMMSYLGEPIQLRVEQVTGFKNDGLKFRPFISKIR